MAKFGSRAYLHGLMDKNINGKVYRYEDTVYGEKELAITKMKYRRKGQQIRVFKKGDPMMGYEYKIYVKI